MLDQDTIAVVRDRLNEALDKIQGEAFLQERRHSGLYILGFNNGLSLGLKRVREEIEKL